MFDGGVNVMSAPLIASVPVKVAGIICAARIVNGVVAKGLLNLIEQKPQ